MRWRLTKTGTQKECVGAAVSGRTSNDMQKARGWDDSGDDCAGISPDFYPAAPPDPSVKQISTIT